MADKIWLVRSGGRILGPFDKSDLADKLKTREVSLHDEVAGPMQIWRPIVSKNELSGIVSKLKVQIKETETKTSNLDANTYTVTEKLDPNISDELTQKISPPPVVEEIVFENIKEEPRQKNKEKRKTEKVEKSYGYQASPKAKQQAQGASFQLWKIVSWLAIVALLVVGFYYLVFLPGKVSKSSKDSFALGKKQLDIGLYSQAEKSFEKAYLSGNNAPLLPLYLGALMAQLSTDVVDAEKVLLSVRQNDAVVKSMVNASLSVLALRQNSTEEAKKWTDKSLASKADYVPSLLNSAWIDIDSKNYTEAEKKVSQSVTSGNEIISSYFMYALMLVNEMQDVGVDPVKVASAKKYINKVILKHEYLYAEALLLDLYINNILVGDTVTESDLIRILDVDPQFTSKFRYNVFVAQNWRQWSYLFQYCNKLSQMSSGVLSKGLLVLCHLKAGRVDQAQVQIEGALYASPNHPILNSLDALIKKTKHLDVDASVSLGNALKNNRGYLLPYIMQIDFCRQANDVQCVMKNSQVLISKDSKSLEAKAGMAWAFYKKSDYDGALSYVEEISLQTTDYIPSLQVQDMVQGE